MTQAHTLTQQSEGAVRIISFHKPPFNHVDADLLAELAAQLEENDQDSGCRVNLLRSEGKVFSAGADFNRPNQNHAEGVSELYGHAMKLFRIRKPIVTAIQGAAVGAGLGLAVAADFRVSSDQARFSANFNRVGIHPGFGLTVTLPRLIGEQKTALLMATCRRIKPDEALAMGLVDEVCSADELAARSLALAQEIAAASPYAVQSTRETLRLGLADRIVEANKRELAIQLTQFGTPAFEEGVAAVAERRLPVFDDV